MIACFERPLQKVGTLLGGRNPVVHAAIDGIGRVVVKTYTRGGMIRHFNEKTYLRIRTIRSRSEYELLGRLKGIGLRVPDPVAFAYRGVLFYNSWLVTREISDACTLAELSLKESNRIYGVLQDVNRQIFLLINHGIYHPDLHPGNVLVDVSSQVYFLDFDKTKIRRQNPSLLRERYARRWRRAVLKHRLPAVLNRVVEQEPENA